MKKITILQASKANLKILKGNRPINGSHVKGLIKSFESVKMPIQIFVNEKNEIIDGQHRYIAAQKLGLNIELRLWTGGTLQDAITLNAYAKRWSADDFLYSYCLLGYNEYINLKEYKDKYKLLLGLARVLFSGNDYSNYNIYKRGEFALLSDHNIEVVMAIYNDLRPYLKGGVTFPFAQMINRIANTRHYNHKQMMHKLNTHDLNFEGANLEALQISFERVYNYKNHKKIHFDKIIFNQHSQKETLL